MNKRKPRAEAYLERYLTKHSEHPDMGELTRTQRSVWTPGDVRVREEGARTNVDVDFGRNRMRYSYVSMLQESTSFTSELPRTIEEAPWRYGILERASIYSMETNAYFDIAEHIPEDWTMFVDFSENGSGDCAVIEERCIITVPNFANKFYIMTLMHEAGHAWDFTAHPALYRRKKDEDMTAYHARQMERERNADAFALRQMRPFLSTNPEDSFSSECFRAHSSACRQSYIDAIHEQETTRLHQEAIAARLGQTAAAE